MVGSAVIVLMHGEFGLDAGWLHDGYYIILQLILMIAYILSKITG